MSETLKHTEVEYPSHNFASAFVFSEASADYKISAMKALVEKETFTVNPSDMPAMNFYMGYPNEFLLQYFKIPDLPKINMFLDQQPQFVQLLPEIVKKLREHFLTEDFRLDIYNDPEYEAPEELRINVLTNDDPEIALDKLDEFDESYWIDANIEFIEVNISYL